MTVPTWDHYHQRILNAHEVPPRNQQVDLYPEVPVRARIVWEKDGVEHINTTACAYSGRLVLVHTYDRRSRTTGVWLDVKDAPKSSPRD